MYVYNFAGKLGDGRIALTVCYFLEEEWYNSMDRGMLGS